MKKILKIVFFTLLVIILTGLVFWTALYFEYPWWTGAIALAGIAGLITGYIFLKKNLLRRREKEFVKRVIEQNEKAIQRAPDDQQRHLKALQESWAHSLELLRQSYLRKKGNPLYVLPWYLMLGESGAGKTTAIKNTNLHSPISEVTRAEEISVTRNCEWWFFEEAIILDTAGRYTIPVNPGPDREEWEEFLTLLSKYRRREPINGVIITIAADKLQKFSEAQLSDEGQSVRKRIDQLMQVMGAKFPVYVLVTKMDLVQGMVEFCSLIPQNRLDQAMGYINRDLIPDWEPVLETGMTSVANNLRDLQLLLVHSGSIPEPEVFLFLNNFERLKLGLRVYIESVFKANPYQETPWLRGLFFSSAVQEGREDTGTTSVFGLDSQEIQDMPLSNGIFLKDLFKRILPDDRGLFKPVTEYLAARHMPITLGLVSWVLIWICLSGFMAFSFNMNKDAIRIIQKDLSSAPAISSNLSKDIPQISIFRSSISSLENANRKWFLPGIGFQTSNELEKSLKTQYLTMFGKGILEQVDSDIRHTVDGFSDSTDPHTLFRYVLYLTSRLQLLESCLEHRPSENTEEFSMLSDECIPALYTDLKPGTAEHFTRLYLDYISWENNRDACSKQLVTTREILTSLLNSTSDFKWITQVLETGTPRIHIDDFWIGLNTEGRDYDLTIPGIYTQTSVRELQSFFTRLEEALPDSSAYNLKKKKFWQWYESGYYESWKNFARQYHEDIIIPNDYAHRQQYTSLMTSANNPFFRLAERMAEELSALPKTVEPPLWAQETVDLQEIRKLALVETEKQQESLLGKISDTKDAIIKTTLAKVDQQARNKHELRMSAAASWKEYSESLEKLSAATASSEAGYKAYTAYMNSISQTSLFNDAERSLSRLGQHLMRDDTGDTYLVMETISGPLRYLKSFCRNETACILQQQWEEEVLGGLWGIEKERQLEVLFDKNTGLVWKFLDTTAKPFVSRNKSGFDTSGGLSLRKSFLSFLTFGAHVPQDFEDSYFVTIESVPLEVNTGATIQPHACFLELQCMEETAVLENYNYPQKKLFTWKPESCGTTVLTVQFPGIELIKRYEGKTGFADFLNEFRNGSRIFTAEDFPEHENELDDHGISWVKITYNITGSRMILQTLDSRKTPWSIPETIVTCWTR